MDGLGDDLVHGVVGGPGPMLGKTPIPYKDPDITPPIETTGVAIQARSQILVTAAMGPKPTEE
jgi:hypothetical protein